MKNSYKHFENIDCKYFPCHADVQELNCLFCYCPLYPLAECPGNYSYIDSNGTQVKECSDCTFPHEPENYDIIISLLSK